MEIIERWPSLFKALSEPVRLRLLALLATEEELCVCDLVSALESSQSMISRHLAYLKNSGWLTSRRDGLWIHYRLTNHPDPLQEAIIALLCAQGGTDSQLAADRQRLAQLKRKNNCC